MENKETIVRVEKIVSKVRKADKLFEANDLPEEDASGLLIIVENTRC